MTATAPFNAGKHPRGAGGLFAASAAAKSSHPTGAWAAGPVRQGSGRRGAADARVSAMQRQLNVLGVTDEHGRPLLVDGIDGGHTTAAVKKWQAAHGMQPTGIVDAKTMVAILSAKPAPPKSAPKPAPTARSRMTPSAARHHGGRRRSGPAKPAAPAYVDRGRGFSRMGPNAST